MSAWDTIRRYRYILGSLGVALLLALLGLLLTGGDDAEIAAESPTSTSSASSATPTQPEESSGVPSLDCNTLLSTDVISDALGVDERPVDERNSIGFSRGEVCTSQLEVDDGVFVRIEPGDVKDFGAGTEIMGTTGEPVTVLADDARWFGDETVGQGVLSVRQETSLGMLVYRITVGRPDLDDAQRMEVARALADHALRNFPGVQGLPPEPIVDLCELVTDAEAEAILSRYRDAHPATLDETSVLSNLSQGVDLRRPADFSCRKLILAEIYIEVTPGAAGDFEPGSQIEGVSGQPVADIGDEAVWFGAVPAQGSFSAPHEQGILSVRWGDAFFRIVLALPDTSEAELLHIGTGLASGALTRIPGDRPPVEMVIASETADLSGLGYVGNLLAKEEAGDWSRGEGLVATLRMFAGELEPDEVLRQPDLADYSGAEVLALASEYLTTGADDAARAQIDRLLDLIVPSLGLLEEATQDSDSTVDGRLLVSARWTVQEDDEETPQEWCMRLFHVDAPCLIGYVPPVDDSPPDEPPPDDEPPDEEPPPDQEEAPEYRVFVPVDLAGTGWSSDFADWAYEAMLEAGSLYETLGDMPSTSVTLWPRYEHQAELESGTDHCSIMIGTRAQEPIEDGGPVKGPFQQRIAARMALCMLLNEGTASEWWGQGMPIYLSGVVYPEVNLEHLLSEFLRDYELDVGLLERRWINWVFFERLHSQNGAAGNLSLARSPLSEIAKELHLLVEDLTDVTVPDIGPGLVPYDPPSETREISAPTKLSIQPGNFGVERLHVIVPDGKIVCEVEYEQQGGVTASWRPGAPGSAGGTWSRDFPTDPSGEMVFAVTGSGDDSQFVANFDKVEDADDGCEEQQEEPPPLPSPDVSPCCDSDYYKKP